MSLRKYSFELSVLEGIECDSFLPRWTSYNQVVCEGNEPNELFESATVDVLDQDGGEVTVTPVSELSEVLQDRVARAIEARFAQESRSAEESPSDWQVLARTHRPEVPE